MGYVSNNLTSGERVLHLAKVHWFIFAPGTALMVVSIWLFTAIGAEEAGPVLGFITLIVAVVSLVKAFLFKVSTELAVTTKRVIAKSGFISRKTIELNHSKVESFNVDQSIAGRIFGFGTVIVCGTGGGKTPIANIDNPLEFRRQAMSIADEASSGFAVAEP